MYRTLILLILVVMLPATATLAAYDCYQYDPSDFAVEYTSYFYTDMTTDWLSGMPFDDPATALGRPTVDTTGDNWVMPITEVVPVNPAYMPFRSFEIVMVGTYGHIELKFDHPVRDDIHNPFGIDLLVFGNASLVIGGGVLWNNGDPADMTVGGAGFQEPGIVSVSQDGVTWYSFSNDVNWPYEANRQIADPQNFIIDPAGPDGPFADTFAPTLGRVLDPDQADPSLGQWNQWWAWPTNPTLPLDPAWDNSMFLGKTVEQVCVEYYGQSAGGTGFDIGQLPLPVDPDTGLKWIQYVRIDNKADGATVDIDAVSDVSACGDYKHPFPIGDISKDCRVNLHDVAMLADNWHRSCPGGTGDVAGDINGDCVVNDQDMIMLKDHWMECVWWNDCP